MAVPEAVEDEWAVEVAAVGEAAAAKALVRRVAVLDDQASASVAATRAAKEEPMGGMVAGAVARAVAGAVAWVMGAMAVAREAVSAEALVVA